MKFTLAAITAVALASTGSARLASLSEARDLQKEEALLFVGEPIVKDEGCPCFSDDDCHPTCVKSYGQDSGVCRTLPPAQTLSPVAAPTPGGEPCPCDAPKTIPTKCEVQILIQLMDLVVAGDFKLSPQWLRASFHDAGTFDQTFPKVVPMDVS